MPRYEITGPDGFRYEITAPDGATEDEVIAFAQANYTPAAPKEETADPYRTAFDYLGQSLTSATIDEGQDALGALGAKVYDATLGDNLFEGQSVGDLYNLARQESQPRLAREMEQYPEIAIPSLLAGSVLGGVGAAGTKAGSAVANSLRSGSAAARIAKGAVVGAASGSAYGFGAGSGEQRLESAKDGAVVGGLFGAALPAVGAAARGVKNAAFPAVDEGTAKLASVAINKYNIPLRRSQLSDSRVAKTLASVSKDVPLSGALKFKEKQLRAFNRAVLKTIGEDADAATPEVIQGAYQRIGGLFDKVTKGRDIQVNDKTLNAIVRLEREASESLTQDTYRIVGTQLNKLLRDVGDGDVIKGNKLGSFRSQLAKVRGSITNDAKPYLDELDEIVTDAIVDGVKGGRKLLQTARHQYRNLKTIEPLVAKANDGIISPSLLQGAITNTRATKSAHARGLTGELGELARIGQTFIKDAVPNSGTPGRLVGYGILGGGAVVEPTTAVTAVGSAAAFNALDTAQPLVRRAIKGGGSSLPSAALPAVAAGAAAGEMSGAAPAIEAPASAPLRITIPRPLDEQSSLPEELRDNEGTRLASYIDTTGNRTVGVGFNMDSGIARKVWKKAGVSSSFDDVYDGKADISPMEAEALGIASLNIAQEDAVQVFPKLTKLSPRRQEALIDLSYNLGRPRLAKMEEFNRAINAGKYVEAARYLLKSKYAKQVGERAKENARKIISG